MVRRFIKNDAAQNTIPARILMCVWALKLFVLQRSTIYPMTKTHMCTLAVCLIIFFIVSWSVGDITRGEKTIVGKMSFIYQFVVQKSYNKLSIWHFTNDVFVSSFFFCMSMSTPWNLCTKQKERCYCAYAPSFLICYHIFCYMSRHL